MTHNADKETIEKARRAALQDARSAAVKAVLTTGVGRGDALVTMPQCHKVKCWCDADSALNDLVNLVLTRAADEVGRALLLEGDEDAARLDRQRHAWDEGAAAAHRSDLTLFAIKQANPYREEADRG